MVVGPDEVYFSGSSGGAGGGKAGLWHWASATGMRVESAANLPENLSPYGNTRYGGLGWNRSDSDDIWVANEGLIGSDKPIILYRGKFGSPWTKVQTIGTVDGYSHQCFGANGRIMTMDESGILSISAAQWSGNNSVVVQGDPRLPPPMAVYGFGGANAGSGENDSKAGYYLMTDNDTGNFYIPGTGWTIPTGFAGTGSAALILGIDTAPIVTPTAPLDGDTNVSE
jgi:hypothetical protein